MSYIVRCALPVGQSITMNVGGQSVVYAGEIGIAPTWGKAACDTDCQEAVSACVLAHVNTSGQHIALWMDGPDSALGWGRSTDYPYQEGSFFGNIFTSTPKAFYCNGKDFDQGVVPGRLGASQSGAPYSDPFASSYCLNNCTSSASPNSGDGYTSCNGYKHVVTVWRNFDPNTNYKICNRSTAKCIDVVGSGTANTNQIVQNAYTGLASQKWKIIQKSPGQYGVVNVNSAKCMDVGNGATTSGAYVQQYTCAFQANQLWNFTPTGDGYYKFSPGSNANGSLGVLSGYTGAGTPIQQWAWDTSTWEQWNITPSDPTTQTSTGTGGSTGGSTGAGGSTARAVRLVAPRAPAAAARLGPTPALRSAAAPRRSRRASPRATSAPPRPASRRPPTSAARSRAT